MIKICGFCGEKFETNSYKQMYCSRTCVSRAFNMPYEKYCPVCGDKLRKSDKGWVQLYRDKKYCSSECQHLGLRKIKKPLPSKPPKKCTKVNVLQEYHDSWAVVRRLINDEKNPLGKAGKAMNVAHNKMKEQLERIEKEEILEAYRGLSYGLE